MIVLACLLGVKHRIGQDPLGQPHQDGKTTGNILQEAIEKSAMTESLIKTEMLQLLHLRRHKEMHLLRDLHRENLVAMVGLLSICLMVDLSKTVRIDPLLDRIVQQKPNLHLGHGTVLKILLHETWKRFHHPEVLLIASHRLDRVDTVAIILTWSLLYLLLDLIQVVYIQTA